jgi:DNA-binding transcriptional ArsR family regulator
VSPLQKPRAVSGDAPPEPIDQADRAGDVFGALADPHRRALLQAIATRPASTATELASHLPITRQAVSKHLAALSAAGLLERSRAGREVRYRLSAEPLSEAVLWMAAVGARWDQRLAELASRFESPGAHHRQPS